MKHKRVFNLALNVGMVMLENGAEIYRVEDTIERILKTTKADIIETLVTPYGVMVTFGESNDSVFTEIKKIRIRNNHLYRVSIANDISRKFCENRITVDQASHEITKAASAVIYKSWQMTLATSFSSAFFAVVFGASINDFFATLIIGGLLGSTLRLLSAARVSPYFVSLYGGFFLGILSRLFAAFSPFTVSIDYIIAGGLMALVPGLAITIGITDLVRGELVSGSLKSADAILSSLFIAIGIGISLNLWR